MRGGNLDSNRHSCENAAAEPRAHYILGDFAKAAGSQSVSCQIHLEKLQSELFSAGQNTAGQSAYVTDKEAELQAK